MKISKLLKNIVKCLSNNSKQKSNRVDFEERRLEIAKNDYELKPKYIITNNKSGKKFYALDINMLFPVRYYFPEREIKIVYLDKLEQVKRVLNFDEINESIKNGAKPRSVYELNDSFSIERINDDNTIETVAELRALIALKIDSDYCTIDGIYEHQQFNTITNDGYKWATNLEIADKYAESMRPKIYITP